MILMIYWEKLVFWWIFSINCQVFWVSSFGEANGVKDITLDWRLAVPPDIP
jgi:hypothetical protein